MLERIVGVELEKSLRYVVLRAGKIESFGEQAISSLEQSHIVSALPTEEVLVRPLKIGAVKAKMIAAVRNFQVEPLLPFPLEEALLDHQVIERTSEGIQLTVFCARKESVEQHISQMQQRGIEPDRASCVACALAALIESLFAQSQMVGVIHLGEEATTIALVCGGKVVASRFVMMGSHFLQQACAEESVDATAFDSLRFPMFFQRLELFRSEVVKSLLALCAKRGAVASLFFVGQAEQITQLDRYLEPFVGQPLMRLSGDHPFMDIPLDRYAVALGLALEESQKKERINFRRQELKAPFAWKRWKRPLVLCLGLYLLLMAAIVLLGQAFIGREERKMDREYAQFFALNGQEPLSLAKRGIEAAQERMQVIESLLKKTPETFPLDPDLPKVADLLAWLSTYAGKGIVIERLRYAMNKRPDKLHPRERYEVKVDLQFTASHSSQARHFHDFLLKSACVVDVKKGVSWSSIKGCYCAEFTLKDHTVYSHWDGSHL